MNRLIEMVSADLSNPDKNRVWVVKSQNENQVSLMNMSYLEGAKLEKRFPILWLFPTLSILTQTHMKCNFSSTKFTS